MLTQRSVFARPGFIDRSTATVLVLVAAPLLLAACQKAAAPAPQAQTPEVGVYVVHAKPLVIQTELSGRTTAYQVAEVRPQVNGIIQKRLFTEGSDVRQGTPLYQIDVATYRAATASARADLAKAQAALLTSQPKVQRYKDLLAIQGVSQQDYDDARSTYEQAKADVLASQAALDSALINEKYTQVSAPISGRIGKSSVTAGALVTASQTTALATITQLDPMYVDVTQTSTELLRLKRELQSGKLKQSGKDQANVSLRLEDGTTYAQKGKLQFSEVSVDENTGTVTLRAIFPNPEKWLLPGMYVRAVLDEGTDDNALIVPQKGVTRNQKGEATALVLDADGKVEQKVLTIAGSTGNNWRVESGLKDGDQVIVEGLQKVKVGGMAKVAAPAAEADGAAKVGQ